MKARRFGHTKSFYYLQEIGDGEVDVPLALPVEELRALHHHEVRRKVHSPREGGRAHQHLPYTAAQRTRTKTHAPGAAARSRHDQQQPDNSNTSAAERQGAGLSRPRAHQHLRRTIIQKNRHSRTHNTARNGDAFSPTTARWQDAGFAMKKSEPALAQTQHGKTARATTTTRQPRKGRNKDVFVVGVKEAGPFRVLE